MLNRASQQAWDAGDRVAFERAPFGWEFNGDFMYWHATNDTATFISCWNHVASAIKSTDPKALCDWTINSHFTPNRLIYDFAVKHRKHFAVGEWGVVSGAGTNGGGDNPAFVQNMHSWFLAHAAVGLYESYFSISSEVDSKIVDNTTMSCGCDNPMASAKYLALWHP